MFSPSSAGPHFNRARIAHRSYHGLQSVPGKSLPETDPLHISSNAVLRNDIWGTPVVIATLTLGLWTAVSPKDFVAPACGLPRLDKHAAVRPRLTTVQPRNSTIPCKILYLPVLACYHSPCFGHAISLPTSHGSPHEFLPLLNSVHSASLRWAIFAALSCKAPRRYTLNQSACRVFSAQPPLALLESALPQKAPVTRLESAYTKHRT